MQPSKVTCRFYKVTLPTLFNARSLVDYAEFDKSILRILTSSALHTGKSFMVFEVISTMVFDFTVYKLYVEIWR